MPTQQYRKGNEAVTQTRVCLLQMMPEVLPMHEAVVSYD